MQTDEMIPPRFERLDKVLNRFAAEMAERADRSNLYMAEQMRQDLHELREVFGVPLSTIAKAVRAWRGPVPF